MGFPSPVKDYAEKRLTPEDIMGVTASSVVIHTTEGYAVAEPGIPARMGSIVLLELSGCLVFTEVGVLDNAKVIGVVTHLVKSFGK